jgi:hypothetical protein
MIWEWLALAGLALVALVLLGALLSLRRRTSREAAASHAEVAELRHRLDELERGAAARPAPRAPVREEREYTITGLAASPEPEPEPAPAPPARLERAVFADQLLRESVIRIGSLSHGVRRALSAESRNRIRFEMRREVKRARKQRRVEQREAYREWQARQRETA